jgi:hypothetical protein
LGRNVLLLLSTENRPTKRREKQKNMSYFETIQKIIATTNKQLIIIYCRPTKEKDGGFSECWVGISNGHFKTLVGTSIKSL